MEERTAGMNRGVLGYAVLVRWTAREKWHPEVDIRGQLAAYRSRKDAEHEARNVRRYQGRGTAKVVPVQEKGEGK